MDSAVQIVISSEELNTLSFHIRFSAKLALSALLSITLLSSAGATLSSHSRTYAAAASKADQAIAVGMKYLGTPYEFGSNRSTTRTFDCSDFTKYVFLKGAGIALPSTSSAQAAFVKANSAVKTNWSSLKRGDLMFFMDYHGANQTSYAKLAKSRQTVTHVSIYLGNGKMLHTYSNASGGVRVDSIDNKHWEYRFLFGGSLL